VAKNADHTVMVTGSHDQSLPPKFWSLEPSGGTKDHSDF